MSRKFLFALLLCILCAFTLAAAEPHKRVEPGDAGRAGVGAIAVIFQIILWCCLTSVLFLPCLIFICLLLVFCVVASIEVLVYIAVYAKAAQKNGGFGSKKGTDFVEPVFSASPIVFGLVEFFLPGCGYFALGQLQKGLIALGITVVLICCMLICCFLPYIGYILNAILIILMLVLTIIGVVDVYGLACKCIQDGQPITAREAYLSFLGANEGAEKYNNLDGGRGGIPQGGPHFNAYGPYAGGYPGAMPPMQMSAHMGQYPQPGYVPPNPAMMQTVQQQSTMSETKYAKFDD